jgi:hypothetical protein
VPLPFRIIGADQEGLAAASTREEGPGESRARGRGRAKKSRTASRRSGRSSCITPAFCRTSALAGRVAASATAWTKDVLAAWYRSKTARSDDIVDAEKLM